MQRILSTKNPREASMMSAMVNVVLNVPRYFMITGLTILALVFYSDKIRAMGQAMDFEMVLPDALSQFVPAGLLGAAGGRPAGRFHVELRRHRECRAALHRERPLSQIHQPPRQRADLCAPELCRFVRRGGPGHFVRLVRYFHQYRHPVDRLGAMGRLHGFQRSEVVLVALQRLRLFLGHGDRHRRIADHPVDAAQRLAAEFVSRSSWASR
jgi:hypothetical protein